MSLRWGLLCVFALPAWSQSVISVYSGVIHYSEGSVFLDGRAVEQKPGIFEEIKAGSQLRLDDGRAEVLLTPGVFLRLGAGSSIRMISNLLVDTKVELTGGAAIIDAAEPTPQTSVTVILRNNQIHIRKAGRYRFDSTPPQLRVSDGEAEVSASGITGSGDKPTVVGSGHVMDLLSGVLMKDYAVADDLDNWDEDRSEAIARNNEEMSQTPEIASLVDAAQNDPLASDPALLGPGPSGVGSYGLGSYPGSTYPSYGGGTPYGYGASPYGYGSLSPYGYGALSLYPYSLYYPYALYPSLYPYGIYSVPAILTLPTYPYRYGLTGFTGRTGLGTYPYGYRGSTFSTTPGSFHGPTYRPGTSTTIRSTPGVSPARPMRIGGVGAHR
jgi:hypothetical protein